MNTVQEKKGYKWTEEFGYIPEDWEYLSLGEVVQTTRLGGNYLNTIVENDLPLIKMGNIERGKINLNKLEYIADKKIVEADRLAYGDILFNTRNTPELVGKVAIWKNELKKAYYNSNILNISFKQEYVSSNFFINYIFNTLQMISLLKNIAIGTTSVAAIYSRDLMRLSIPLPPLPEQQKIASVLSDVDSLIDKTKELINKKKELKIATMQKLFENKSNFQLVNLPSVVWFQEGPGIRTWQFTKSGIKVINVTNLENGYLNLDKTDRHISLEEYHLMYEHFTIDENDIVMASSGNSYSKVAIVRKQDLPLLMNTSVIRFKPLKGIEYGYLLIFLSSDLFKTQIDLLITGGAQPNFGPAHLKKIVIPLPCLEEQHQIATILSDMDSEIESLEKELEKYKDLKSGMMQQLLTGKVRLV